MTTSCRRFVIGWSLIVSVSLATGRVGWLFADADADYTKQIKPVLAARCYACHGALKQQSGLRLDTVASIKRGGLRGPAIRPGKGSESLLIQKVSLGENPGRMPPEGHPLTTEQIELIKKWIDQGAEAPADENPEADPRLHWAFQPPARRPIPREKLASEWSHNPIDAFIAFEQQRRKLKPVQSVDKRLLLRRVYLDLIGLPPTRDELRAFLNDRSTDAYERVVDRLLASPQYGERWGRHWMDIWRYSDWYGLGDQLRNSQKHIWHWRDWIVESLNSDKGYDRMITEMLAADEIAPTDRDALRATGFLARNYFLFNRTTWLDDTIEHTSQGFLGLTMNCAKCHDHKYDPIAQMDYYRMRSFFEPHQVRLDELPGEPDLEKNGLPRVFDAHPDVPTYLFIRGDAGNPDKNRTITPGVPSVFTLQDIKIQKTDLPFDAYNPSLQEFVLQDHLGAAEREINEARAALISSRSQKTEAQSAESTHLAVTAAEKRLAAAELRPCAIRAAYSADLARERAVPDSELNTLVREAARAARQYECAKAKADVARAESRVATADDKTKAEAESQLKAARGALKEAQKALDVPSDRYTSPRGSSKAAEGPDETEESRLNPYPRFSTGRRTALARWITDSKNPLTARVAVNHIWLRHFGQPLVESVTDFGRRAPLPPLHDLLDWLSVELMTNYWSMKHIHRLMVTSRTYQLTTSGLGADRATMEKDPNNDFLWRRKPVRMESEMIRDSVLQLAGVLNSAMGGPTIDPAKEDNLFRRSLYFTHSRDDQSKFLSMFDDADIMRCYRRTESIIPQQALTMVNSKLLLSMSRKIAERLTQELGETDDHRFILAAYELILTTEPSSEELSVCREAIKRLRDLATARNDRTGDIRARDAIVHALLNHNDFITIR